MQYKKTENLKRLHLEIKFEPCKAKFI